MDPKTILATLSFFSCVTFILKRFSNQFTKYELFKFPGKKGQVIEMNGSWFHGDPDLILKAREKGEVGKSELLLNRLVKTIEKMRALISAGYIVTWVWDKDFPITQPMKAEREKLFPPIAHKYLFERSGTSLNDHKSKVISDLKDPVKLTEMLYSSFDSQEDFEEHVVRIDYGSEKPLCPMMFVEVDLKPVDEDDPTLKAFGPCFVRGYIDNEAVGLTGAVNITKGIFSAHELQALCSARVGLQITKVHRIWEFKAGRPFKKFVENAVAMRKKADIPGQNTLFAEIFKLVPNSLYGGLLQCKDKYADTVYRNQSWSVCYDHQSPSFKDSSCITDSLFKVDKVKKNLTQNVPIQLGKMILSIAKVHMINFYFNVLVKHLDPDKFHVVSMDTDSYTMAISGDGTLSSIVRPGMEYEWSLVEKKWFIHCESNCSCKVGMQGEQCRKREPGPFKLEFSGHKAVALSSKLYSVASYDPGVSPKVAAKGLKVTSMLTDETKSFTKILKGGETGSFFYDSIQRGKDSMVYVSTSRTISSRYTKRKIVDNVHTETITDNIYCGTPSKVRKTRNELRKTRALRRELKKMQPLIDTSPAT